jgi:hypothetical protein
MPAAARGVGGADDGPWNTHHLDTLPVEVQQYISGICKGRALAGHEFATYLPSEQRWRINLEYLHCDGLREVRRGSLCLDVDFVRAGSHFHLANKQYRDCGF